MGLAVPVHPAGIVLVAVLTERAAVALIIGGWSFISVAIPSVVRLTAREQVGVARRRAERLDERIELIRFAGMLTHLAVEHRRLVGEFDYGIAADGHHAMPGLAPQPVAHPHLVFHPGEDGLVLEPYAPSTVKASRM